MSESYRYRLFEKGDLPGILELWEQTGWGPISAATWCQWHLDGPFGPAIIPVAVDRSGKLLAQLVMRPAQAIVAQRVVKAVRVAAPILREEDRTNHSLRDPDHPMYRLLATGLSAAESSGCEIAYSQPHYGWLTFFRVLPRIGMPRFAEAEYGCLELPLEGIPPKHIEAVYNVQQTADFDDAYSDLWASARQGLPVECGLVRSPKWLRFNNGDYLSLATFDQSDAQLVGYVAIKKNSGLVVDMLARSPTDLKTCLSSVAAKLATSPEHAAESGTDRLKLMATPWVSDLAAELGFTAVKYKFAFVCCPLGSELTSDDIEPSRWYITPGD